MTLRRWASRMPVITLFALITILMLGTVQEASAWQSTPEAAASETTAATNANNSEGINFLTLLMQGGWFMVPLLALSLIVVAICLERLITLRRERIFPGRFIRQLARLSGSPGGLEPRAAYEICQKFPSAASNVFKAMLVKVGRPQSELENAVSEASQRQATRMLQMVSWLGLAAAIAPLIGLLGTVWGITQAFYDTTQLIAGQNRAEALAEGIYTALVTTMFGLIIAIPAAVMGHFFENRVISGMNQIEEMIFNLMPQLERYEGKIRFSETQNAGERNSQSQPPSSSESNGEPTESNSDRQRKRPKTRIPK